MKKIKVKIIKSVYLSLSVLESSKTLMYEFLNQASIQCKNMLHGYRQAYHSYQHVYKDTANSSEKRFDTSNQKSINLCLPEKNKKNKKLIELMKDE